MKKDLSTNFDKLDREMMLKDTIKELIIHAYSMIVTGFRIYNVFT